MAREKMTNTSFRLSEDQLAELIRRAKAAGMTKTDYLLATALGDLHAPGTAERLEALEARVDALERRRK